MSNTPPYDNLDTSFQILREFATNQTVQQVIENIQNLPPPERVQVALTRLTVQALAAEGVPIPADLTITTRVSASSVGSTPASPALTAKDIEDGMILKADTWVCWGPFCWKAILNLPPFGDQ